MFEKNQKCFLFGGGGVRFSIFEKIKLSKRLKLLKLLKLLKTKLLEF